MSSFFEGVGIVFLLAALGFCCLYLVTGTEDLILDLIAFKHKLRPKEIDSWKLTYFDLLPQKKIAILVPAWREGKIIGSMLNGNLRRIKYRNYVVLVGCYPNDFETIHAVKAVAKNDPRVIPVVNSCNGPTSKGQMLNELIRYAQRKSTPERIEAYLLQDSEDIIDPWSLSLINYKLDSYDFVQIPVFSLEVKKGQIVAGTYVDEFAESHTKDLLVREYLGAAIPSAGVGTAFSARIADQFLDRYGWVFYEKSLTEDYEFGIRTHLQKFKGTFAAYWFDDPVTHKRHYIATREYFPKKFARSVRQKTRWTIGIAIQGLRNLGWSGEWINCYYLYRDRRGMVTNIFTLVGYFSALSLWGLFFFAFPSDSPRLMFLSQVLGAILWINIPFVVHRITQRAICVYRVYGAEALWLLPLRWPVAVLVNSLACVNAVIQSVLTSIQKKSFQWAKTEHELPEGFGIPEPIVVPAFSPERSAS